ncbi:MAG: helix-turn-helix transcriptional regulator [Planctomycetota bacterium]
MNDGRNAEERKGQGSGLEGVFVFAGTRADGAGHEVADFIDASRINDRGFGGRVRAARLAKDWSIATLAKRAQVPRDLAELVERRPWDVPFFALQAIAEALGSTLNEYSESSVVTIRADELK